MLALLLAATLLTAPLPPVGLQLIDGGDVFALTWTQQSDANVICIRQFSGGIAISHGCTESIAGPRAVTLPAAPPGTYFMIHEWHRNDDGTWVSYGTHGPIAVPYRVMLPVAR